MVVQSIPCNIKNYGGRRQQPVEYIVIHYTANDGDTDANNGQYFKNNVVGASAHWFVDDDSYTISVPEDCIAWHCGASKYRHPYCRNGNSIGIEICDNVRNGVIYPTVKTIQNALELTKQLMAKYNIPAENVLRHYDVTGKLCPGYWCGSAENDAKWKSEFWNKLGGSSAAPGNTAAKDVLYRVQVGAFSSKQNAVNYAKTVKAAGFDTYLVQIGGRYKVQTGAFSEKSNAKALIARLKSKGFDAFITTDKGQAAAPKKDLTEVALACIYGTYGNGEARRQKLIAEGYDPDEVQDKVNELCR